MIVQEYELNFNQLSKYDPHIVSNSREKINKFSFRVSDLVKMKCRNAMFLGVMNISRLRTHAQLVEGDKLRKHDNENNKARTWKYDFSLQKLGGGNCSKIQQKFSTQFLDPLVFHLLRTSIIRRLSQYSIIHMEVFQSPRHTLLALSL